MQLVLEELHLLLQVSYLLLPPLSLQHAVNQKKKTTIYKLLPASKADHLCQHTAMDVMSVSLCNPDRQTTSVNGSVMLACFDIGRTVGVITRYLTKHDFSSVKEKENKKGKKEKSMLIRRHKGSPPNLGAARACCPNAASSVSKHVLVILVNLCLVR